LDFEILFDDDNAYAESIGLKHGFPDDLKGVYGKFGLNLDSFNGNSKWELPIASRFVVDQTGIIRAADINADYTKRPEPTETVEVLRSFAS
jgi:peroxiredoxin